MPDRIFIDNVTAVVGETPVDFPRLSDSGKDHMFTADSSLLELSIVMPCLNEADTLGTCIEKAQRALREHNIQGEIVIADNGSTDGSQEIAHRMGARVIQVKDKGYGSALMGGIEAAQGK